MEVFSAGRAWQALDYLAHQPRSPGSSEHAVVSTWLAGQMRELGYELQSQGFPLPGSSEQGLNIAARLEGTSSRREAVLLVAHYDTLPGEYGAVDNASGVAVLLEIARVLRARPLPPNDVIFLFSDAEELGVYGAQAFVNAHPWAGEVKIALNFDSFSSGPAFLWNTNPYNGWLVRTYQQVTPLPMGCTWADMIARLMPLDTDLTPFLRRGAAGANFTTPNLPFEIQTAADRPALVTQRSLQHAGEQGLALVGELLKRDLTAVRAPDVVYFNLAGPWLVVYDSLAARVLATLALGVLVATVMWMRHGRGKLSPAGIVKVLFFNVATLVALPVLGTVLWFGGFLLLGAYPEEVVMAVFVLVVGGLYGLGYWRLRRETCLEERLLVGEVVWGCLVCAAGWLAPALSQPLTLAYLCGAGGAAAGWRVEGHGGWPWVLAAAGWGGMVFYWTPVVYFLLRIAGPVAIPAGAAAACLVLGLLFIGPGCELLLRAALTSGSYERLL